MTMMRFYDGQHGFYAGIDLHARRPHLGVEDANGTVKRYHSGAGNRRDTPGPHSHDSGGSLKLPRGVFSS
jgi:hypothetical protein